MSIFNVAQARSPRTAQPTRTVQPAPVQQGAPGPEELETQGSEETEGIQQTIPGVVPQPEAEVETEQTQPAETTCKYFPGPNNTVLQDCGWGVQPRL